MSKIRTKISKVNDEYKLTIYSGDESFDLYFDTEEDADNIADLAQSYDSFEEAQAELDADGDEELDDEEDELDDEDEDSEDDDLTEDEEEDEIDDEDDEDDDEDDEELDECDDSSDDDNDYSKVDKKRLVEFDDDTKDEDEDEYGIYESSDGDKYPTKSTAIVYKEGFAEITIYSTDPQLIKSMTYRTNDPKLAIKLCKYINGKHLNYYDALYYLEGYFEKHRDKEYIDVDEDNNDEDTSITEKAAGYDDIKSVVDALNNAGVLKHKLVYEGILKKDASDLGVTIDRLGSAAVDAGAFRLIMDTKDENNREKIVSDVIKPLGYHEVYVDHFGSVVVPKSISKSKLVELIEQGAREDYIEYRANRKGPDYNTIFQSDKMLIVAGPSSYKRHYDLDILDITPKSLNGFIPEPEIHEYFSIKGKPKDSEALRDVVKGSTSVKTAATKVKKYLDDNGIKYK